MALANEANVNLVFDTEIMRGCGYEYQRLAGEMRVVAVMLDRFLSDVKENGGECDSERVVSKIVNTEWSRSIERYAGILESLKYALDAAATEYDMLVTDCIEKTGI